MSVSGLAEGLLAGFNTMDRYERGKQMDERAEREQGLREALMTNQQEQQKLNNQRYDSEVAYRKERDSLQDARQNKLDSLNEQNLRTANARASRIEARQNEMHEWDMNQRKMEAYQKEHMPLWIAGYEAISQNQEPPDNYWESQNSPLAGPYNLIPLMKNDHLNAAKVAVPAIAGIARDLNGGKLKWGTDEERQQAVARINDKENIITPLNTIFSAELAKEVGRPDKETGKVVSSRHIANIIPSEDFGHMTMMIEERYSDGTSSYEPMADSEGNVIGVPTMDFAGSIYRRAGEFKRFSENQIVRAAAVRMGLASDGGVGPDHQGYRKAVANTLADAEGRISKINADPDIGDQKVKDRLIEEERSRSRALVDELGGVYGVSQPKTATTTGGNGGGSTLSSWAGSDPSKQQFLKEAEGKGRPIPDYLSSAQLDKLYQTRNEEAKADAMLREARGSRGGLKEAISMPAPSSVAVSGGLGDAVRGSAYQSGFSSNWRNPPTR